MFSIGFNSFCFFLPGHFLIKVKQQIKEFWQQGIQKFSQIAMTQVKNNQTSVLLKSIVYGSLTAIASLPFEHPLDALKTNMQSSQTRLKQTVSEMIKRKGWRAFYNGFGINSARVIIKQAYRWPLWISVSNFFKKAMPDYNQFTRQTVIGFSISFCELFVMCPFQRLKIWLMTTETQEQTKIKNYFKIHTKIKDLYTGFTPLLARQGLSWASFLSFSQIFKNKVKQYKGIEENDKLSSMELFLISMPVAILNTAFIMPVDCIKTFYQHYEGSLTKKNLSFNHFLIQSLNKYGLKGLYLGWQARILQYMIQSAFTLIVIEDLHFQYNQASKDRQQS